MKYTITTRSGIIVSRDTDSTVTPDYDATIGTTPFLFGKDYSRAFAKTPDEKSLAIAYHADWKRKMVNAYGEKWRKQVNPPGVV